MKTTKLISQDIHCENCAASVTRALLAVNGVQDVRVDVPTKTVVITHEDHADESAIQNAMEEAGFDIDN